MGLFDFFKKKSSNPKEQLDIWKLLPIEYLDFLNRNPNGSGVEFNEYKDEDPDGDGRYWELMGNEELLKSWEMKGVGETRNFECLYLYVKLQREYGAGSHTISNVGKIPLDRVERGFVIGTENGDYLYLDFEDNCSVWIYYHDGGDVRKVASSFKNFLKEGI